MKETILKINIILIFILASYIIWAQTGTVRGFIYDENGGEPLIFTNVYLKGTTYGAQTDVNGFYSITKIPPGKYILNSSFMGYKTIEKPIEIIANKIINQNLTLKALIIEMNDIVISSEKREKQVKVKISEMTITPKDIERIPTIGGERDLITGISTMPGFILTGDQGGQLYVRGGSPIQNKIIMDGMIIYAPFHTIGLFSVFDLDVIRNTDIYTGGYNAEHGGRISSIMDITTKDGNKQRLAGKFSTTTMGSKLLLEGPLKKSKQIGVGSTSFILSGKTNYLDKTKQIFYNYIDQELPFSFIDLYGKMSFNGSSGNKFNVFGFNYKDDVNYSLTSLDWKSGGIGSNFVIVPQGSPILIEGNFAYSKYNIQLIEKNKQRNSSIKGFNAGLKFTYFINDDEIKYGVELVGFSTDFSYINAVNKTIKQIQNTSELAGYFKYKYILNKKLILEPGYRIHYYASLNNFSFEPRFRAKYNVSDKFRLKLASGIYSQNLISTNNNLDVVNLFNGFLSGPQNIQSQFQTENNGVRDIKYKLQKAKHLVIGFEYDVSNKLSLNVESYYKKFDQLTTINRDKTFEDIPNNANFPDYLKKDYIIEEGNAYGIDFTYKYTFKKVYLWVVYSLAKVNRWNGRFSYPPVFDRRHNINIVFSYNFGNQLDWTLNCRWNYGSGFPFTRTQGSYEKFNFSNGINTDYTRQNGEIAYVYDKVNQGRLPDYHRFDVTVQKIFAISENSQLEINAGVTNAYDRKNAFYYDRANHKRVNQLPIMPSVGVNLSF